MGRSLVKEVGRLLVMGLVAGAVATGLLWLLLTTGRLQLPATPANQMPAQSITPGMDYVDAYRCPRGMTKLVQVRGEEDGFSRSGAERAVPRAALLKNDYYRDLLASASQTHGWRNFDEVGTDKILIESFAAPKSGVHSGELVLRAKGGAGSENDYLSLGDFDEAAHAEMPNAAVRFIAKIRNSEPNGLLHYSLTDWVPVKPGRFDGSLIEYLNAPDRVGDVDFLAQDDTAVDFAALVICQLPKEAKGITLREMRVPMFGPGVSLLSCSFDKAQGQCDAFAGDMMCSAPLPLACYRPGQNEAPQSVRSQPSVLRHFVNGEVKLTSPVKGEQFKTLANANRQCEAEFGSGWRVLSQHEGGGGVVISLSKIAPRSRAWVDIRDQQYANCWDRDKPR